MADYFCALPALGLAAALVWALWKGFEAAAKDRLSPVVRFYVLLQRIPFIYQKEHPLLRLRKQLLK